MRHWSAVLLALGLVLPGCGKPSDSKQPKPDSTSALKSPAELKSYAAADLPAVVEARLVLDGGRVELSPPEGWKVLPRDSKYLIRLVKGTAHNSLPRLTVTAESAPEGTSDVTEANVAEFSAQMEQLSAAVQGRKILEPERPILVGDYAWSRHVRQLSARGTSSGLAAVQSLATARSGRLYVIELTVESPGDSSRDMASAVMAHRNAAYALAANWKFIGAAAEPATAPPEKEESSPAAVPATTGATAEKPSTAEPSPEKNPD
jgi:hypothetical protein